MPRRSQVLATDEIYHVYNRSVGHAQVFVGRRALLRVYKLLDYYRFPQRLRYSQYKLLPDTMTTVYTTHFLKKSPLVEVYAFSLMPNHYHLLLKQLKDGGTVTFLSNIQNGFAKYFNISNDRHGTLFEHPFKAKWIETDEEFLHVSRYIHLNPVTSFLNKIDQISTYQWTSLSNYMSGKGFVNSKKILEMFPSKEKYLEFVTDQADYQKKLGEIKHLMIDG